MTQLAIVIIQARSSSSRLPNKVLKPLAGLPMIWHIVQRARSCQNVGRVVVATSIEPSDDALAKFCEETDIECYRGSLSNVLSRYMEVLKKHEYRYFVRVTGDCPLIHPPFIDRQIEALLMYDADLILNDGSSTLLEGQGAFSTRSLLEVSQASNHPDDLEHVGARYYTERHEDFRTIRLQLPPCLQDTRWRLTVDEADDYHMLAALYEALYEGEPIPLKDAVAYLESHPEVATLNQSVKHSVINQELASLRSVQLPQVDVTLSW